MQSWAKSPSRWGIKLRVVVGCWKLCCVAVSGRLFATARACTSGQIKSRQKSWLWLAASTLQQRLSSQLYYRSPPIQQTSCQPSICLAACIHIMHTCVAILQPKSA